MAQCARADISFFLPFPLVGVSQRCLIPYLTLSSISIMLQKELFLTHSNRNIYPYRQKRHENSSSSVESGLPCTSIGTIEKDHSRAMKYHCAERYEHSDPHLREV